MSLDSHALLTVARVAFVIGSLVAWFLVYKWTEKGTEAGLSVSNVSMFSHGTVKTAWLAIVFINAFLSDLESRALTVIRIGILLTLVTSLLAWVAAESRRRSSAVKVDSG
ncbi:hypothetical protein [Aeromicrobium sp.]|uniref:hypothetical protein n=1 Tax=Aeromicrobium sp. TaxID=1871063 RepID=UPI0019845BD8|nr:hypothetical protein [Aeromicrobium sp.]MBC7633953.1 hypothetical protein [Aeromicrobium sp.]